MRPLDVQQMSDGEGAGGDQTLPHAVGRWDTLITHLFWSTHSAAAQIKRRRWAG